MHIKNLLTQRMAGAGLAGILSLLVILHSLILLRIVPFEVVWGGRLKSVSEMVVFETISIAITLVMLTVAVAAGGYLTVRINRVAIRVALLIMLAVFLLNTIGNLLSTNRFEQMIFAPITLIASGLCMKLASVKKSE